MKKILFIGLGWEQMPYVKVIHKMGYKIVAVSNWKEKIEYVEKTYLIDSRDIEKIESVYLEEKPEALLADECDYSMYAVAYLAEKYNIPGPSFEALTITNNKALQREVLKNTSINQPEFYECWKYSQVIDAIKKIGYPAVIKSIDNRGSIGVFIVKEFSEVKDAWLGAVSNSHSRRCLVEQYIKGKIITADGFFDSKTFHYIASSTKDNYIGTDSVAKVLYYPGKLSDLKLKEIKKNCEEIVRVFKINYGFTHFEFIIEQNSGKLYFIEGANRGGGVFISDLILNYITGINWIQYFIQMSLGKQIEVEWKPFDYKKKCIMYFLNTDKVDGIEKLTKDDSILAIHINSKSLSNRKTIDARDRAGVIILVGNSYEELLIKAEKIEQNYGLDIEFDYIKEFGDVL